MVDPDLVESGAGGSVGCVYTQPQTARLFPLPAPERLDFRERMDPLADIVSLNVTTQVTYSYSNS